MSRRVGSDPNTLEGAVEGRLVPEKYDIELVCGFSPSIGPGCSLLIEALGSAFVAWLWFVPLCGLDAVDLIAGSTLPAALTVMTLMSLADVFSLVAMNQLKRTTGGYGGRQDSLHFGDFESDDPAVEFTRADTDESIRVTCHVADVPSAGPATNALQKLIDGTATPAERDAFSEASHGRIGRILTDDVFFMVDRSLPSE